MARTSSWDLHHLKQRQDLYGGEFYFSPPWWKECRVSTSRSADRWCTYTMRSRSRLAWKDAANKQRQIDFISTSDLFSRLFAAWNNQCVRVTVRSCLRQEGKERTSDLQTGTEVYFFIVIFLLSNLFQTSLRSAWNSLQKKFAEKIAHKGQSRRRNLLIQRNDIFIPRVRPSET